MICCPTCGQALPPDRFSFDVDSGVLVCGGRFVHLPRREAHVLEFLLERRGRTVTRSILFQELYRGDDEPDAENVVESHVSKLRRKILPLGLVITSERYKGYRLTVEATL
ncbi:winged helix-turn-helix domain-containing protein [Shinella pollutisoli]|uniref:Winged helix-turn-helix domain-containing protein n=1 Tax=Shinella pollutisoli TaxID=2250594 RepID=A0ABV7DB45_9HYPH|nr:winged helix-turn-helix domain-containing protein [Shinella pollutisoli]